MDSSKAWRVVASSRRRLADLYGMAGRWWHAFDTSIAVMARAESRLSLPLPCTHRSAAGQPGDRLGRLPPTLA